MSLTITTAPTLEPLTLAQAKEHLRVETEDTESDDVITALISAARSKCESFLRASLLTTEYTLTMDGFPPEIILPQGPVLSSDTLAITYVDTAGAPQTLASSGYKVSLGDVCRIRPAWGQSWPATRNEMDAVSIVFEAGFAAAADVPPAIVTAVKLVLHDLFENRGNIADQQGRDVPIAAHNLMTPFIRHA